MVHRDNSRLTRSNILSHDEDVVVVWAAGVLIRKESVAIQSPSIKNNHSRNVFRIDDFVKLLAAAAPRMASDSTRSKRGTGTCLRTALQVEYIGVFKPKNGDVER